MIILVTGTPGAGKTLYTVSDILTKESEGNRPIFVDGIPDLKTRHEPAQDILEWHKWAPDGSLIVIDEAQRIWRPMPSGARVPDSIQQLETHRHRGIDFVVITQHPNLLHSNVRKLVGKHIHLRRTALGVYLYEWSECGSPENFRSAVTKIRWNHPKKAFGLYKSASQHVKVKHRLPPAVYVFGLSIVLLGVGATYAVNSIKSKMTPKEEHALSIHPQEPLPSSDLPYASLPGQASYAQRPLEPVHPVIAFTPRFPDDPASAPAYDGLRQVAAAPRITQCIASKSRCICYTQQATRLQISEDLCRRYAQGLEFDPYSSDQVERHETISS